MSQVPKTNIHGDILAQDLIKIVHDNLGSPEDYKPLLEALTIYVVDRDHKIYNAGIEYGKQLEKGDIEPEEEQ